MTLTAVRNVDNAELLLSDEPTTKAGFSTVGDTSTHVIYTADEPVSDFAFLNVKSFPLIEHGARLVQANGTTIATSEGHFISEITGYENKIIGRFSQAAPRISYYIRWPANYPALISVGRVIAGRRIDLGPLNYESSFGIEDGSVEMSGIGFETYREARKRPIASAILNMIDKDVYRNELLPAFASVGRSRPFLFVADELGMSSIGQATNAIYGRLANAPVFNETGYHVRTELNIRGISM